jgi:KipI family sensor histidine kinase inhibitor
MTGPKAQTPAYEILPLGQDCVLVRFARKPDLSALSAAQRFRAVIAGQQHSEITEVAPSLASVLLRFDPGATPRARIEVIVQKALAELGPDADLPAPTRRWHLPVAFGADAGPQLAEAAALAGLTQEAAVRQMVEADLRVLAIGFAPGQPYIGLLPENWNLPRLSQLTPKVPAGALVVAVRQLVLFCNDSTTGWRQIGQTGFRPFWPHSSTPFRLEVGDAIRIEHVSQMDLAALAPERTEGLGGARLEKTR